MVTSKTSPEPTNPFLSFAPGKGSLPRIVRQKAHVDPPRWEMPICSATVSTEATINWRQRAERQKQKADRLGVPLLNCFQRAVYTIDGRWYCGKHAAVIALQLLAEDAP